MKVKYTEVMYNLKYTCENCPPYIGLHTNAHLSRTDDVVHNMSEICTHENHRFGVKYY